MLKRTQYKDFGVCSIALLILYVIPVKFQVIWLVVAEHCNKIRWGISWSICILEYIIQETLLIIKIVINLGETLYSIWPYIVSSLEYFPPVFSKLYYIKFGNHSTISIFLVLRKTIHRKKVCIFDYIFKKYWYSSRIWF